MLERYYRMLEKLHIGCEKPRAYFIPFDNEMDSACDREKSELFTLLNGEWDFAFFPNVEELDIEDENFPSTVTCPDKMTVPFCWQLKLDKGYDIPQYINQDYPYPVDPPFLPDEIPCGFYRRDLKLNKADGKKYYINFEGVSSCFYLWINGAFVGYSQVSHCTSEFDVTDKLTDGDNLFEVLVVKNCDGSYLEDQDFFRLSGIFRDVYILERDSVHIKDIHIDFDVNDTFDKAEMTVKAQLTGKGELNWKLLDPDGKAIADGKADGDFSYTINNAILWNAENPKEYSLIVNLGDEWINFALAVRKIEIKDKCLLLNGEKIKIRGINRHDSHPETGYAVTVEHMMNDLLLLKRANVNAIRTSHYPNDPRFMQMCQKIGFMMIDEADIETHGMGYNYGDWFWDYWAYLSDTPEWKDAYIDRAERLYERDKNFGCVIMWSLGNESGCGRNHRHMANFLRSRDPKVITHYENARLEYSEHLEDNPDFTDISDVESRMYASLDYLKEYLENPEYTKPFFYCEYVAAWSTGDIPLHWDEFEHYDNYCGGCIWELTDHAVNIGTAENPKYRYGGDFGDWPNDNISCVDGLVFPDRKPRPGYYDMKITYQPYEITLDSNKVTVKNKRYFETLNDIYFEWTVEKNGKAVASGRFDDTDIAPQGTATFNVDDCELDGTVTLIVRGKQKADTQWASADYETGHKQFVLADSAIAIASDTNDELNCTEDRKNITVTCGKVSYTFSKIYGKLTSINNGTELLTKPMEFSICKPTVWFDSSHGAIERARFDHAKMKNYGTELVESSAQKVVVKSKISFAAAAMPPALWADVYYTVTADGKLNVSVSAKVTERAPALPRFGLKISMPKSFENVSYFGYGPVESYSDRFASQLLSEYSTTVTDNYVHYVRPVESSAHYKTKTAFVSDGNGNGLRFADTSADGFSFNATHYSDEQISATMHDDELVEENETVISVDFKHHACVIAPGDMEPWRKFNEKEFSFSYDIIPV